MRYLFAFTLFLICNVVYPQDTIKVAGFGSMSNLGTILSQKDNFINFEFSPLSDEVKISLDIYDYTGNNEIKLFQNILVELLKKKENAKIYTSIEQNERDVNIKSTLIGHYLIVYPIKSISEERINIYPFKPRPYEQNKIVPILLLMDNKNELNRDAMNTIAKILNCQKLEDISENDIEYFRKRSNMIKIITYKMDAVK